MPPFATGLSLAIPNVGGGEHPYLAASIEDLAASVFDSFFDHSRASAATYFDSSGVMQTAASGVPRRKCYDPSDGSFLGALIEPDAATNLILNPDTRTGWTYNNITQSDADFNGIDGSVLEAGAEAFRVRNRSGSSWINARTTYTPTSTIQRESYTFTTPVGCTTVGIYAQMNAAETDVAYQDITVVASTEYTLSFYHINGKVGGVQLELGDTASSFIPGGGTTRAAETLELASGIWRSGKPATVLMKWIRLSDETGRYPFFASAGGANRMRISNNISPDRYALYVSSGVLGLTATMGVGIGEPQGFVARMEDGAPRFVTVGNGTSRTLNGTGAALYNVDSVEVPRSGPIGQPLYLCLLYIWAQGLSDAQMDHEATKLAL